MPFYAVILYVKIMYMEKITNPSRAEICGKRLKKLIRENKTIKTQERFAELMNINVRTVKRWVKEGVDSLSTIKEIADLLEVSDTELLFEK